MDYISGFRGGEDVDGGVICVVTPSGLLGWR
jgi:hypothetical protein